MEVDSSLTRHARPLYKCSEVGRRARRSWLSAPRWAERARARPHGARAHAPPPLPRRAQHGNPERLWSSATSVQQPLLDALDVLIARASWRDSVAALLMVPLVVLLRRLGGAWIWATARRRQRRARCGAPRRRRGPGVRTGAGS